MFAVIRCLLLTVLLMAGFAAKADSGSYTLYTDAAGHIYLAAPKKFVLIHSSVSIPMFITPENGLLKLSNLAGAWQVMVLTDEQWLSLQLTPGSSLVSSINYGDFDGDGLTDIRLVFNNGQPAITVSGLTTIVTVVSPSNVVTYLHTDVLGSVIAESDANGNITKKTDYKPFGQSKDN